MTDTGSSDAPASEPSPEQFEHQLELVVTSRIGEVQVTWTIFGIFWAAQVLLVGVLFQGAFPPHAVAGIAVSLVGVAMSAAWALTQNRSLRHLERFEDLTKVLEEMLRKAGRLSDQHQLAMAHRFRGVRARTIIRVCCWGATVTWLGCAVLFLVVALQVLPESG